MKLKGKTSIVTGAGRGIGKAIALGLAKEGSDLIVVARTTEQIESTAELSKGFGVRAVPFTADVTNEKEVQYVIEKGIHEFGKIDILINNAGILPESIRVPIAEVTTEDWDRVLETNLKGMFLFTRGVLPIMRAQNNGFILTISSLMGRWGFTNLSSPYTTSKFGICGFMEVLFKEVKDTQIRISMVCPGIVDTDFQSPARRQAANPEDWLKPEDVAEAVVFILTRPPEVVIPELLIYPRVQFPQGRYY
mgnify:FL=1